MCGCRWHKDPILEETQKPTGRPPVIDAALREELANAVRQFVENGGTANSRTLRPVFMATLQRLGAQELVKSGLFTMSKGWTDKFCRYLHVVLLR